MKTRVKLFVHGQAQSGYVAVQSQYDDIDVDTLIATDRKIKFITTDGRGVNSNLMYLVECYHEEEL